MSQPNPGTIKVDRSEFRERFEQLLDQVTRDGTHLTIEEDGQPVAVLSPPESEKRRQARTRFLKRVEQAQKRANLSAEEAESLADEAVRAARGQSA